MITIELTEEQARDLAWCLMASIDAAVKLGLGAFAQERIALLRRIAPAQADSLVVPAPVAPTSWLDSAQWQDVVHAVENMIRLLHTQPNQRDRLATYERLLKIITAPDARMEAEEQKRGMRG